MAASSVQGFSLFPTTVPKIQVPNPHKRTPSLHRVSVMQSPQASVSPSGESIVIKMEEQPPMPQFPTHLQEVRRDSTPSPEDIGRAVTTTSPIDGKTPAQPVIQSSSAASSGAAVTYTPSNYHPSAFSPPLSSSLEVGSETTLVQSVSNGKSPAKDPSPIVPIRSMFPTYDPSVPLKQQNYVPQRPIPAYLTGNLSFGPVAREEYRSSLSTPFVTPGLRSGPPSVVNFPTDAVSVNGISMISTHRELEKLWQASHGTEPDSRLRTFNLEMARIDEATFVFGAHPSLPFYTLQTYDTNEIAVSKTSPRKASSTHDIVLCPIEPASRRLPPNDGLVAFIFPKLAAMLAINQSAALAKEHNLAPTDRDDIEAQAVRRAARQEACNLRFNTRTGNYELEHPAIGRGSMAEDFALKSPVPASPTTIRSMTGKPVLLITVNTDGPLPCISVTDPNASSRTGGIITPQASAGAGIRRLSTIPQTDTSTDSSVLASLDLTTEILHLDANAILELMPSLFSIDCIVSAILAIAIGDAKTNLTLGGMEIWKPRPAPPSRLGNTAGPPSVYHAALGSRSGLGNRPGSVRSYSGSVFYATIAERQEAEEEAKLMRQNHERDVRGAGCSQGSKGKARTWFGRFKQPLDSDVEEGGTTSPEDFEKSITADTSESARDNKAKKKNKNKKPKKPKKVVVSEFDLEKLGHYQSGERKGQELPAVTRSALGGLVMALRLFVWFLTKLVHFIAWLLVNVSRAVTSEKF
ncbi:uncharacterized protein A1O9_02455 [Exophiala aquamarina CBS 119918]|uniref:Uncharacterized protein n=1 Tax=Exophiala aquamarina CBS 119918 TaxID=1182545 RepID=A0A072PLZ5_9EURO|nr:uncharacterized protein A1O9_02455 [Exophiala aquamarina CBS 119918]KEF60891.1 hypothetical protein A1O9_02455 [Exophiala aquamarina CBS 119918]